MVVCPLCRQNNIQQWRFQLLVCKSCGLGLDQAIFNENSNELLEAEWFGSDCDLGSSWWVRQFEKWKNKRTFHRISSYNLTGCKLIEIGVGSGSFLQYAKKWGFDVSGCDLSKEICSHVTNRTGIKMHVGNVADLPISDNYDIVVLNHVLEHTNDPIGMLNDIKDRLVQGGILHLAVPNVDCWEASLAGWTSYEPYHLLYFTPQTLIQCLEKAGLQIVSIKTNEPFSGWFLAVLRSLIGHKQEGKVVKSSFKPKHSNSIIEHIYRVAMIIFGFVIWPLRII